MRIFALACAVLVSATLVSKAQNNLAGVIYDGETALEIPEASVFIKDTELTTQSTQEGAFMISDVPPGTYTISFSKPGFQRVSVTDVVVPSASAQNLQVILNPDYGEAAELDEVTMTITQLESATAMLLANRQTAAALTDSIGSDDFSRLGIGDAAEALAKVTGATVVGGKFVYIRGLGDRYGNTTLNDIVIPSPDPDRNAVPLDLFPAGSIDSIETFKTFTPDKPGNFTGGLVNIVSRTIPEETIFDVGFSTTYNTQATGNDKFLTFPGGGDFIWAGYANSDFDQPNGSNEPNSASNNRARAQLFSPTMFPTTTTALPNFGFDMTYGDSWELGNSPVGLITAIDYSLDYSFYDNGVVQRINPTPGRINPVTTNLNDSQGVEEASIGYVLGTAIEPSPDDMIGLTFLYNHVGAKDAQLLEGTREDSTGEFVITDPFRSSAIRWIERQLWVLQLDGEHTFTRFFDAEFSWFAQYGDTSQDEPDSRFYFDYFVEPNGPFATLSQEGPERRFRNVSENQRDLGSSIAFPFDVGVKDQTAEVSGGWSVSSTRRLTIQEVFSYDSASLRPGLANPNDMFTRPQTQLRQPAGASFNGRESIWAGYLMGDIPVNEVVRVVLGARVENTNIESNSSFTTTSIPITSSIVQTDILPAASVIWQIKDDMNLRFAFSETVARPTFREISPIETIDFLGGDIIIGNPDLQITEVQNYDARWEWFPSEEGILATSVFYKSFSQPIERTISSAGGATFRDTWENFPDGELYGLELEAGTNLGLLNEALSAWTIGLNGAYVQSSVSPRAGINTEKRPLEGQSEWVFNADLTYAIEDWGLSTTVAYNWFSRRLSQVGQGSIPDIYEEPVGTLDFFITKTFGENDAWRVTLSFKNVLNPEIERKYDGTDFIYSSYTKGVDIGISGSYSFY